MAKKVKKSEQEEMIEDIKDRLSDGEELRDIANQYGMSCRAVCRLMAKVPEAIPFGPDFDNSEDGYVDPDFE